MLRTLGWVVGLALCCVGMGMAETDLPEPVSMEPITVQGQVLDADGRPLSNAKASLETLGSRFAWLEELLPDGTSPQPLQRVSVDRQGRFRLTAPESGLYAVRIEVPGHLPVEHVLEPLVHDTYLAAAVPPVDEGMVVELRSANGSPAKGARVVVRWQNGGPWQQDSVQGLSWRPAVRRLQIGNDGAAILPYASGEELDVYGMLPEHALWTGRVDAQDTGLDVRLEATPPTHRVTVMAGEEPVPLALLTRQDLPLAKTDVEGRAWVVEPGRQRYFTLRTVDGRRETEIWKPEVTKFSLDAPRWRDGRVLDAVSGNPVPGAIVWSPKDRHMVRTDDQGTFRWPEQRPAGSLRAAGVGYRWDALRNADGESGRLEFSLQPAAGINGRVVTESGQPVPQVPVEASLWLPGGVTMNLDFSWQAISDEHGRFRFPDLEPGSHFAVWARQEGWVPAYALVSPAPSGDANPRDVELVLRRGTVLQGRALDAAAMPIEGVEVQIFPQALEGALPITVDDEGHSAPSNFTDARGRFEILDVPQGRHLLMLSGPGWGPETVPGVSVDQSMHDVGDVVLQPGQQLELHLVDELDRPVRGVQVDLDWSPEAPEGTSSLAAVRRLTARRGHSDASGRVTFSDLPRGRVEVTVKHPKYSAIQRPVQLPSEVVRLTLDSAVRLAGRVVDSDGTGLAGLEVLAETLPKTLGSTRIAKELTEGYAVRIQSKTDGEGRFDLQGVKPGTVQVAVRRGSFALKRVQLELPAGEEPEPLLLVLEPGVEVRGSVIDGEGRGVTDLTVMMSYVEEPTYRHGLVTDANGHFRMPEAPPGLALLAVRGPDDAFAQAQVKVEPGMAPVVLTLETQRILRGQVVGPDGQGLPEAQLTFAMQQYKASLPTDAEGRFAFPVPEAATFTLLATRSDLGWVTQEVEVPATGAVEEVRLEVPRGVRIVGQVRGATPEEIPRLNLWVVHAQRPEPVGRVYRSGQVNPEAAFTAHGIMPGKVSVNAKIQDSVRQAFKNVEVPEGAEEIAVELDLSDPGFVLSGRILHNGAPAHSAQILPGGVQTDAEGRFRIEGVQAGPVEMLLIGPWGKHDHSLELYEDRDIEILIETYNVSGMVIDTEGRPLADVEVMCRSTFYGSSCGGATDAEGRFELRGLPPGEMQLSFLKEGYGRGEQEVLLDEDRSGLVVTLHAGTRLSFSVQSWNGEPETYLGFHFWGLEGQPSTDSEGFLGEDGLIHVDGVPPGKWQAYVSVIGSRAAPITVTSPGGPYPVILEPAGELQISLPKELQYAEGRLELVDPSGSALVPRDVGLNLPFWPVRTRIAFARGLSPGTWTYRVILNDGPTLEGTVEMLPGERIQLDLE